MTREGPGNAGLGGAPETALAGQKSRRGAERNRGAESADVRGLAARRGTDEGIPATPTLDACLVRVSYGTPRQMVRTAGHDGPQAARFGRFQETPRLPAPR